LIEFINDNLSEPYIKLKNTYLDAIESNQKEVQALLVASYSKELKEVDARFVNLKIVDNNKFIFFSNYNSPKSNQFNNHPQISCVLYWSNIDTQIRMKAKISKTPSNFSDEYFNKRSIEKNALALSSAQSKDIKSYREIEENYNKALKSKNLDVRPKFWGGYQFVPYYFEFWKGHKLRLNKREAFKLINDDWKKQFLQP
tara:strand:- start:3197 stop:3793 length:597 start_codon:yes stop_codon:yes gene_type:complete